MSRTPEYARAKTRNRLEKEKEIDLKWTPEIERFLTDFFDECVVCGDVNNLATDHVKPLSRGYGLEPGNAVRLCRSCNSKKKDKMPDDLPAHVRDAILSGAEMFRSFLQD